LALPASGRRAVALGGAGGVAAMLHGLLFQFQRSSPHSIWVLSGWQWLRPAVEAAAIALIGWSAVKTPR
jgi:hypothetical protein